MRLFYAITLPNDVLAYLHSVQAVVKSSALKGNFTTYHNFHITLKYIGETDTSGYDDLCEILDDVTKQSSPFTIKIGDLGSFPRKNKHIMWVGVTSGKQHLNNLFQMIEQRTLSYGFLKEERKYRPHITLGREIVLDELQIFDVPGYDTTIDITSISLMQSHRVDGVLTYTPLYTKTFSKSG